MADEDLVVRISLPLFNAGDPVTAALDDPHAAERSLVVSTDGSGFWFHTIGELRRGGSVRFSNLQAHPAHPLTADRARIIGLDVLRPTGDRVKALFGEGQGDLVVFATAKNMGGDSIALCFADPDGWIAQLAGKTYQCSANPSETYSAADAKTFNYKCPNGDGGVLK